MFVRRLKLNNYRNYERLEFSPSPGANIIFGKNAQGKTNVIEAVFLCAFCRSHRTTKDSELIMHGKPGGYVGLEVESLSGSHLIELRLREGQRKQVLIDGRAAQRSGELMGLLKMVMFSPEDLFLIKGGPAERRRFVDMELCQLSPAYFYRLQSYNRALKQRNAAIKDACGEGELAVWDGQLAALGSGIMSARSEFILRLAGLAAGVNARVSGGEQLGVGYIANVKAAPGQEEEALLKALTNSRKEDLRRGFTTAGPHRDDIGISLFGQDIRAFGSQGQQRTAALALKLAELELVGERAGEPPVLLLDDVFSELDGERRQKLVESAMGCQSFITSTSLGGIEEAGLTGKVFACSGGTLAHAGA